MTDVVAGFPALAGRLIRTVPDWPTAGVQFRDVTPLLADPHGLEATIDALVAATTAWGPVDAVLGVEARGFILAPPIAARRGAGFVPVRKAGKLPAPTVTCDYELEYGSATIELSASALRPGARVVVVDDVLATGGTLAATHHLAEEVGAEVVGTVVLVELPALGGRARLAGRPLESLLEY